MIEALAPYFAMGFIVAFLFVAYLNSDHPNREAARKRKQQRKKSSLS